MRRLYVIMLVLFAVVLGFVVGLWIGYKISPLNVYDCLKKLDYQNVSCGREGQDFHCIVNGTGYKVEYVGWTKQ
jgi:hypothetical protein